MVHLSLEIFIYGTYHPARTNFREHIGWGRIGMLTAVHHPVYTIVLAQQNVPNGTRDLVFRI